eukprot:TRINITY_DN15813_c0_g6_i1.p1 TRINITY_DN15813_c0_g6~~TRINITY_DN15813_c0_g6_i1.p1  ORF type:complete len:701 (+),score=92.63 TRINITY_DN15813_c0_g6_i1:201-2303(+)
MNTGVYRRHGAATGACIVFCICAVTVSLTLPVGVVGTALDTISPSYRNLHQFSGNATPISVVSSMAAVDLTLECNPGHTRRVLMLLLARAGLFSMMQSIDHWVEWRLKVNEDLLPVLAHFEIWAAARDLKRPIAGTLGANDCARHVAAAWLGLVPLLLLEALRDPSSRFGQMGQDFAPCPMDSFRECDMPTWDVVAGEVLDAAWASLEALERFEKSQVSGDIDRSSNDVFGGAAARPPVDPAAAAILAAVSAAPPGMYWVRPEGTRHRKLHDIGEWQRLVRLAGPSIARELISLREVMANIHPMDGMHLDAVRCRRTHAGFSCDGVPWGKLGGLNPDYPTPSRSSLSTPNDGVDKSRGEVASCVTGPAGRLGDGAALRSFATNVLKQLQADGFVYMGLPMNGDTDMLPKSVLMRYKKAVGGNAIFIEEVVVQTDPPPLRLLEALVTSSGGVTVPKLMAVHAGGIWAGPLWGHRGGALYQYFERHACLEMIVAAEQRRGREYSWVTFSRIDLFWMWPHWALQGLNDQTLKTKTTTTTTTRMNSRLFPASVANVGTQATAFGFEDQSPNVKSTRFCLVPEGEEHGGVNDRHALVPRNVASDYAGLWSALLAGDAFPSQPPTYWNPEMLLARHLARAGLALVHVKPRAAVACCHRGPQCDRAQGAREAQDLIRESAAGISMVGSPCIANFAEWVAANASVDAW